MSATPPVPRYRPIDRSRASAVSLDEQLPEDHPVRAVWGFVCQLDLGAFRRPAKAVVGRPGAPLLPAELLFALWLFATTEGVTSARLLAEKCTRDLPYQWLCGGEPVNYHSLADFFADHGAALHGLFVEHIAALRQQGLIDLAQVTLDGRKVPANASKDRYRREGTLRRHLDEAAQHLQQLEAQRQGAAGASARQAAAQRRAARERHERLQRAVAVVRQRQEQRRQANRKASPPEGARANETDPDAAKMKMPDGGYRQAYNAETVTDVGSGLIVTVAVTNQGSDNGQLGVMMDQLHREQHTLPQAVLSDSGFVDQADVGRLEQQRVHVLMPPKNERQEQAKGQDPYARKRRDSDAVATWRARMGEPAARQQYRRRAPVAEGVHAQQANRGWRRFRLRGLAKVWV
ncbi:MAG TPA: transposase, partial [Vicinamibacteria bacterium]|nr:transposase [Vicinamibacteria bacterium]